MVPAITHSCGGGATIGNSNTQQLMAATTNQKHKSLKLVATTEGKLISWQPKQQQQSVLEKW